MTRNPLDWEKAPVRHSEWIQADVGHVVDVLARDEPDDLTDLAFGVMLGHAGKRIEVDLLLFGELRDIVESSAPKGRRRSPKDYYEKVSQVSPKPWKWTGNLTRGLAQ